jgi:hypothetical protein
MLARFIKCSATPVYSPQPLNASLSSLFTPTTTISILIDELFVEHWINHSNYSNYFLSCAPRSCSYTYVQRMDALYMITTLLGLYGGLTFVLRFVVWHGLRIIRIQIISLVVRRRLASIHITSIQIITE